MTIIFVWKYLYEFVQDPKYNHKFMLYWLIIIPFDLPFHLAHRMRNFIQLLIFFLKNSANFPFSLTP